MNEVAKVIPLHGDSAPRRPRVRTLRAGPDGVPSPTQLFASRSSPAPDPSSLADSVLESARGLVADQVVATAEFIRRRLTGDYQVDEFGFDPHFAENVWLPLLRPLFDSWFRVEVRGIENVPAEGGALVVANHAGVVPIDGLMTSVAMFDKHPAHRPLRMLAADLAFEMPVVGNIARKAGHTLACNPDAERLLRGGEVAAVFPEGFKGIGKPFSERYKLQRFGRGGFVSAALRTGVPIVPCSIVGSEEIYPKIGDLKSLARLLGMPYFPVTPLFPHFGPLGLIPLPSKWYIEFGEPIVTDSYDAASAEDPMVLFELTDHVRETIQQTLYRLLAQRRNVFLG
ncbi:acyltransferase family protein [Rhodococcus spelaei]|uniref:Acyltransferase family protein n=1 Tax=Rhodococcus spelaei TaxID=2546320 RepID=A0A541B8E7_9NOCA|nr:lysophospholipid acyltransferase family protein [Rhodococcus spelaei]TQF68599.1 acyltransferase family protein [Rhodococcus spelaei]